MASRSRVRKCETVPPDSIGAASRRREDRLAALAWGVAHPMRVRILRILAQRETCICGELVHELPVAQSTVSQHLKILKDVGLVQGEIDGPRVCYCINRESLAELKQLVGEL
ncbi:MAG: ArsR/SmtB family transcription factor [Pirellulaceae bacterium]